ncbi:MAG TPA: pre-mycofactocin synthase MftD [Acidimicrobiales bacterium]|nr:pre-mycofactocin synthase MftD [Acidimicrobiales bacterium]
MAHKWFESVEIARRRAEKTLPRSVFGALKAGSEAGETLADNEQAFRDLGFVPTVADKPAERDQSTQVMGQSISMPVLISPTGVQMVHPEAEIGIGRACANRGTAMGLSNFGSTPMEALLEVNPQTFFQIYWCGTREQMTARIDRAKRAGVPGLIVTLDWSFSHGRDWGSPDIPEQLDLRTTLKHAPELLTKPKYAWRYGRYTIQHRELPDLHVPNMVPEGESPPGFFEAYGQWMGTPPPSWDDLAWLRDQWDGPFMLKGVMRVSDARKAVDAGYSAISVSNHGGNNLDTTPAPIRALPLIADAVGDRIEVVMDGGIRRGSDVVKAVALGADAVMIGRASLWALAVSGQAGVENVLDVLRNGVDSAMLGLGKRSLADLGPSDIVVPDGFSDAIIQAERSPDQP